MVEWGRVFGFTDVRSRNRWHEQARQLLPSHDTDLPPSGMPAKEVTKVALRLKYQIEQVIPIELDAAKVTKANSAVITDKVIKTAKEAGGDEYRACVVYCLLVVKRWFLKQAMLELWDSELHDVRAVACEIIAKRIIEDAEDQDYLMRKVLLERYSVLRNGDETEPANVIERAVDMHALEIIGSSGYQKTIKYLWHGWIVQNDQDAGHFIEYKNRDKADYWLHFDADRMRTPLYQNGVQIFFSVLYLVLYTECVNTINEDGDLDIVEAIVYVMTLGFIADEFSKFWKVGRYYFGFWNAFNGALYALLTTSFVIRMMALTQSDHTHHGHGLQRSELNKLGYHFFAFSAPMFWMRLLLYLDVFRFFGAMLVVLKVMMRESLIFFALLIVVCIGFLQAFIGLNQTEGNDSISGFIFEAMVKAILTSPEFEGFDTYAPPFGLILYYIFSFVVMVILLNILIALFNSAYEDITANSLDEYMALFAQKTMRFVRAPDENVFIAPFNLIEIFGLVLPFEWWLPDEKYERLNHYVMTVIYSPLLLVTALYETYEAKRVRFNRKRGEEDDDTVEEWEQMEGEVDFEAEGWTKTVERSRPNVEVDGDILEIRKLQDEVRELKDLVKRIGSVEPNSQADG
ncbi:Calcium channel yvc1 [Exophiala xenobiotica]|uniref:Calcium channel yvc1 n=1 Tax=Lithohypha guttulata TaxID=1690604 RepID=A0ABR0JZI1_9EURO|nr:Calcium channel yvc1 [Lithohypha guttulata]KAK5311035.1 Calcium channel yvc1 [Exophiala xenobiotica]